MSNKPNMPNKPNQKNYKDLTPFDLVLIQKFPFIEEDFDAINLYGILSKIKCYLNTAISNVQIVIENQQTLNNSFTDLYNYVENYFTNLDVQDEINNKLDEMVEDGTLERILTNYTKITKVYNTTVQMMQDSSNIANNQKIKTLGYYNINDGGGSEFYITNQQNNNIYQFPIGNLYANIICKDNINVKQLGAKGNGVNDDTQAIKNALKYSNITPNVFFPKGEYLISDNLIIPNGTNLMGENTKNSIIILSDWIGEHCITNEHFEYDGNIDTISIKNLTFKMSKYTEEQAGRMFGFCNTDGVVIDNVTFKCDNETRLATIDIRSNNKNMLINKMDCYFTATTKQNRNCLCIRETAYYPNDNNRFTDNIRFTNCNMYCSGIDEMVWVDNWNGIIKNIKIDNCNFYDVSKYEANVNTEHIAQNMFLFSCQGIEVSNCHFYKESLKYMMGRLGVNHAIASDNIKIHDCLFEIGDASISTNAMIINVIDEQNNVTGNGIELYNNTFIINQVAKKPHAILQSGSTSNQLIISHDNNYNCECEYVFVNVPYSKNDIIKNANKGFINIDYIEGLIANITTNLIDGTQGTIHPDIKIINSDITTGNRIINVNNKEISKILIKNCIINNNTGAIGLYNNPSQTDIMVVNSQFANDILAYSTNQSICIEGSTLNGQPIKGIPSNPNLRAALPVGTVLFSSTQGKSVARKISEGNSINNWEEL